jgi:hypothetical protein
MGNSYPVRADSMTVMAVFSSWMLRFIQNPNYLSRSMSEGIGFLLEKCVWGSPCANYLLDNRSSPSLLCLIETREWDILYLYLLLYFYPVLATATQPQLKDPAVQQKGKRGSSVKV